MKTLIVTCLLFVSYFVSAQTDKWLTLSPVPNKTMAFAFAQNFPTKVMDNLQFSLECTTAENVEIYLLDAQNNQIAKIKTNISPENATITLPLYQVPAGKYTVYIQGKKSYLQKGFYVSRN